MQERKKKMTMQLMALALFLCLAGFAYKKVFEVRIPELGPDSISFAKNTALGIRVDAASSDMEKNDARLIDLDSSRKEIDLIAGMGADLVRLDLEKKTLENAEELAKLDQVIAYARSRKMQICLAYIGRRSWLPSSSAAGDKAYGGGGKAGWEEFRQGYKEDVISIVNRYRPEYFLILPGCPRVVGEQVDGQRSIDEWFDFAKEAGLTIKRISFSTQIALEGTMASGERMAGERDLAETVMGENDAAIDIFSMRADNALALEEGAENIISAKDRYHWRGKVWMGDIVPDTDLSFEEQEDYFLYALHLANREGFSGIVLGRMRDAEGEASGLVTGDYAPKIAYTAIKQVLSGRK